MTLGLEGGDVHRNAAASKLIAVKSSSAICNPLLHLQEKKIVPARSSVSPGRLIVGVRKGVKWAAGGLGGYFWAAPGDISGCGLERNGSEADNWGG